MSVFLLEPDVCWVREGAAGVREKLILLPQHHFTFGHLSRLVFYHCCYKSLQTWWLTVAQVSCASLGLKWASLGYSQVSAGHRSSWEVLGEMCVLASSFEQPPVCLGLWPPLCVSITSNTVPLTPLSSHLLEDSWERFCLLGLPGDPGYSPHVRSIVTGSLRSLWSWKVVDHRFLPVHQGSSHASSAGIHPFTVAKPLILSSLRPLPPALILISSKGPGDYICFTWIL